MTIRSLQAAFLASALLLAPLSALAQDAPGSAATEAQEADLPREARILVQRGLAFLGFDPGPADGLFGPKTRAAIWDWQAAKELEATGYLTMPEAEALAALGVEAGEKRDMEMRPSAGQPPVGSEAGSKPRSSGARNQVLYFPARLTCGTDEETPEGCWAELSSPAGCFVWAWPSSERFSWSGKTLSWSGECDENTSMAYGRGTLKPDWADNEFTGELVYGKRQGHWVVRYSNGTEWEGPYVDGKRQGRWVSRQTDVTVWYYYVDGERGRSVLRFSDGTVAEGRFVDGKQHGRWEYRYADGRTEVMEYRHGEQVD